MHEHAVGETRRLVQAVELDADAAGARGVAPEPADAAAAAAAGDVPTDTSLDRGARRTWKGVRIFGNSDARPGRAARGPAGRRAAQVATRARAAGEVDITPPAGAPGIGPGVPWCCGVTRT